MSPEDSRTLASLYAAGLSPAKLGRRYGVTRQCVWQHAQRHGVAGRRRVVERSCAACGERVIVPTSQARRTRVSFCDKACYAKGRRSSSYQAQRNASYKARRVLKSFVDVYDGDGTVVLHVDGNLENQDPGNLMVFASAAERELWVQGQRGVEPLWRGDGG